jgi:hypothetical protein
VTCENIAALMTKVSNMVNATIPSENGERGTNVVLPVAGKRGNPSQGWLQSDKDSHTPMWQLGVKYPTALAVLHFMISRLQRGANGLVISAPALARAMGISERTAKSATAILRDMKFVQILKSGNTNVYIVNSRVAWQSARGARYASFNAQIVVDEHEQHRTVEEIEAEAESLNEVPVMEISDDGLQSKTLDIVSERQQHPQGTLSL